MEENNIDVIQILIDELERDISNTKEKMNRVQQLLEKKRELVAHQVKQGAVIGSLENNN
ncbi:MAG: hypothetical protein NC122_08380 [Faecalibacterium sp.]|nr:hypothetical protein [Ruminococcus sp.]MCM1392477.1 hypothetical protein [Ruminococcus sp.]MCM1486210.1 hypothetical protein [Faecalibacterium sp.]